MPICPYHNRELVESNGALRCPVPGCTVGLPLPKVEPTKVGKWSDKVNQFDPRMVSKYLPQLIQERESGYDLLGYLMKYGEDQDFQKYMKKEGHLKDEFKLPHHITFSTDSVYSNEETPGGKWTLKDEDKRWHYAPSDYVIQMQTRPKLVEHFAKYEPDSVLDLPDEEEGDQTIKNVYSSHWRDLVR